jgi:hypothetical protein
LSVAVPLLGVGLPASGVVAEPVTPGEAPATLVRTLYASQPVGAVSPAAAQPVAPEVVEVPAVSAERVGAPRLAGLTAPQPVDGYGVVGATWRGRAVAGLRLAVRTRSEVDGRWSGWQRLYRSDAAGAGHLRSGTDPFAVGEVALVQLRALTRSGRAPRDLELSVVDPGRSAFDHDADGRTATPKASSDQTAAAGDQTAAAGATQAVAVRARAAVPGIRAPQPRIRTRAAWGANPRLRSGTPDIGRVRAAFVHHTVNANRYSRADVPAIIRGIYAYHTQSLGWSDIGYNFLIDRFGRKWVGRRGGVERAVIGAHAFGYNHLSTGISAIGNFETREPSHKMVRAFGRLIGWKLGLHGVRAGDRTRRLDGTPFRAINGHRDADATACPGINLYRRIDNIRRIAVRWQHN